MARETKQLMIPPAVAEDAKAFELVRAWIANGSLHVSLEMGGWDDPTAWGVVMADLIRHVANFYREEKGLNPEHTMARIREVMEAEFSGDDPEMKGGVVQ